MVKHWYKDELGTLICDISSTKYKEKTVCIYSSKPDCICCVIYKEYKLKDKGDDNEKSI